MDDNDERFTEELPPVLQSVRMKKNRLREIMATLAVCLVGVLILGATLALIYLLGR
jgi:hypothetical protein